MIGVAVFLAARGDETLTRFQEGGIVTAVLYLDWQVVELPGSGPEELQNKAAAGAVTRATKTWDPVNHGQLIAHPGP